MPRKKRPLTDVSRYIAARIAEWESGGRTLSSLAAEIGVSHAHLSPLRDGKAGAGDATERGAARVWFGGSRDALERAAKDWAAEHPLAVGRDVELDERYDARARGIDGYMTLHPGVTRADVVRWADAASVANSGTGMGPRDWYDAIEESRARERRAELLGAAPAPPGLAESRSALDAEAAAMRDARDRSTRKRAR
jgi:hypothetical protein